MKRGVIEITLVLGMLVAIYIAARWAFSPEITDKTALNYLKSAVFDLENPTPENANMRAAECDGWADRAATRRAQELPESLIQRYEAACKKAPARREIDRIDAVP